ncbi:MAG: YqgE/AlgH family protein [Bdellovibrionales bacterium]|nr:YqgE/AlgH family protein [Massilia sp.]
MKKSKIGKTAAMPGMAPDESGRFEGGFASSSSSTLDLANHFLIAMPSMSDPIFGGAVVYICEHNDKGVLGVVINKPTDMTMEILFERIELQITDGLHNTVVNEPIMFGGPVQDDRGFVLHTPGAHYSSSLTVTDDVAFTTSIDVLEAVAAGNGPQRLLVSIGYAGWSPGQLEEEIGRNGWLTVGADPHVLFDLPIDERYNAAIKLLGIDPMMLASEAGHA